MATSFVPEVVATSNLNDPQFDGVLVVTDKISKLNGKLDSLKSVLQDYSKIDCACENDVVVLSCDAIPSKRLIFAPTGPLNRDYDDVRRFADAAGKGALRATKAGCRSILLVRPKDDSYPQATRVALLGALQTLYVPLDVRELVPAKARRIDRIGLYGDNLDEVQSDVTLAKQCENGRLMYRDIGGSDPERMAAPRVAEYVQECLKGTCIKVDVLSDLPTLEKNYPLLAAVNRCAHVVTRHQARLITLEYQGDGPVDQTLLLVGKGITYDTGGADLKVGGVMAGMHRDKCGSAFVAGFFKVLSMYKPKGLKVLGAMCMVRNSIGPDAYVSDEIIVARSGKRIRIGNTDAEGRMVMADVLCHMKEKAASEANPSLFTIATLTGHVERAYSDKYTAASEVNPSLFTIATLTGHVIRAFSDKYTAVMDNGPARKEQTAQKLQEAGDLSGDMFEISTIRREDYEGHSARGESEDAIQSQGKPSTMTNRGHQSPAAFLIMASGLDRDYEAHTGKNESEDVLQANTKPSTMTDRGHQNPSAFLIMASGLDSHGIDSDKPLKFTHLDIAGSSGPFPGTPTGAPVVAMAHRYIFNRQSGAAN